MGVIQNLKIWLLCQLNTFATTYREIFFQMCLPIQISLQCAWGKISRIPYFLEVWQIHQANGSTWLMTSIPSCIINASTFLKSIFVCLIPIVVLIPNYCNTHLQKKELTRWFIHLFIILHYFWIQIVYKHVSKYYIRSS